MMTYQRIRQALSGAQAGIWFSQQLEPENPIYNAGEYIEINGTINVNYFKLALEQAVKEAEALHIQFGVDEDEPWQMLCPPSEFSLHFIDVSNEEDPRQAAKNWMTKDIIKPVNLISGPLFCQALFKIASDRYYWYQRIHHIVMDGFGFSLIAQRVAHIYTALINNRTYKEDTFGSLRLVLEEDLHYRTSEEFERDRRFWLERFADHPEVISLAKAAAGLPDHVLRKTAHLSPDFEYSLKLKAEKINESLPVMLIAAAAAYVHRLTGSEDVILSLPVMGRLGSASLNVPGMVMNLLPLRLPVRDEMSLTELTKQVSLELRLIKEHQNYRHEDLRRELKLLGGNKRLAGLLINILPFDYGLDFAGSKGITHKVATGPIEDLSISIYNKSDGKGLCIDFDANPENYSLQELTTHQKRFLHMLEGIADHTDVNQMVGRIEIIFPEERKKLLMDWNPCSLDIPSNCLNTLFEEQAVRTPQNTAVVFNDTVWTYEELNLHANQLAHFLIGKGAGPKKIVALALPRSLEMIAALLAVVKTGASYLPIDPEYPRDRISFMLEDANPACILTTVSAAAGLPEMHHTKRIVLDEKNIRNELKHASADNPVDTDRTQILSPFSPAYIIYTSGSTGVPKGVVIPHQNVVRLFGATEHWFHFNADDVWTMFHSYAFDFSVWEIWGPLLYGGCMVVVPFSVSRSPSEFLELLVKEKVTVLNQTPSAFYQLMQADRENTALGQKLSLRFVIFGGEALELGRLEDWYSRHPENAPVLINMYGITETTVHVSYLKLDRKIAAMKAGSLIGRGIEDLKVYVLDACLQPVPPGVTGELYIAGAGLALGYLGRPDLTASRFVADPFGPPGTRMYRTGDLARWNESGSLDYIGRSDYQIKIRGFRIELGEITSVLMKHPDIEQAVAVVREDQPGDKRLAAYVIPAANASFTPACLRNYAADFLPDYMVPSAFVKIDALPLTSNGKLDYKALPEPDWNTSVTGRGPRTPQEEILRDLFMEILQLPHVGIDDNFFELGGHSLLAVQLINRIRNSLGFQLNIGSLFETPTVAGLAEQLKIGKSKSAFNQLLVLRTKGKKPPLFCIHPAGGLSWCYAGLTKALGAEYPIYGIQARGIAVHENFPQTMEDMAADYIRLMRCIQPEGPYHLLGWSLGGNIVQAMAVQLQNQGQELHLTALLDAYPGYYLPMVKDVLGEEEALNALLALGRCNMESLEGKPKTLDSVMKIFQQNGSALADLTMETIQNMKAVYLNSIHILSQYHPKPFNGNILFIRSVRTPEWIDSIGPEKAWSPYIQGKFERYDIDCTHIDMCQPEPLIKIGRILMKNF